MGMLLIDSFSDCQQLTVQKRGSFWTVLFTYLMLVFGLLSSPSFCQNAGLKKNKDVLVSSHQGKIKKAIFSVASKTIQQGSLNLSSFNVATHLMTTLNCDACIVYYVLNNVKKGILDRADSAVGIASNEWAQRVDYLKGRLEYLEKNKTVSKNTIRCLQKNWIEYCSSAELGTPDLRPFNDHALNIDTVYHIKEVNGRLEMLEKHFVRYQDSVIDASSSYLQIYLSLQLEYQEHLKNEMTRFFETAIPPPSSATGCQRTRPRIINHNSMKSCKGLSAPQCENHLKNAIYSYVQDGFSTVQQISKGNPVLQTTYMKATSPQVTPHLAGEYVDQFCGQHNRLLSVRSGNTIVVGGNLLISDKVVFIGQDILESYRNDLNNWVYERLELTRKTNTRKNIEARLKDSLGLGDRAIVWVGTDDRRKTYDPKVGQLVNRQNNFFPFYHIDLFLTLGRITKDSTGLEKFTYFIGRPVLIADKTTTWASKLSGKKDWKHKQIEHLSRWVDDCRKEIDHVLDSLGYLPDPIEIPFPLLFKGNQDIKSYFSYNNGLMECAENGCAYLMPEKPTERPWGKKAKTILQEHDIKVTPILNSMRSNSGIHCQVKVIERE